MAKTSTNEKAVKPNVFMRIGLFIKQIIDELRKVVFADFDLVFIHQKGFWGLKLKLGAS